MDWTDVKPDLVFSRSFDGEIPSMFSWNDHLEMCGAHASEEVALFGHVHFMEQTVLERLCPPGSLLFVNTRENGMRPAKVESCVVDQLYVEYLDVAYGDRDWISYEDILLDQRELELAKRDFPSPSAKQPDSVFVNVSDLIRHKDKLDRKLYELIQPGQYFEIQEASEPRVVQIGKVLEVLGGVVVYETVLLGKVLICHLCDIRCHALGWTTSGIQEVSYYESYTMDLLERIRKSAVPSIVFEWKTIKKHRMQKGSLVEVQDSGVGSVYFPGHVSEVLNEHYFRVTTSSMSECHPVEVIAHRSSPTIHPVGYCSVNKRQLLRPPSDENISPHSWSWQYYKDKWNIPDASPSCESNVDVRPPCRRIPAMQYVEVFCYRQGTMCAGLIVRSTRDTVWVLPGHELTSKWPLGFSIGWNCLDLFPCGFAAKYDIPFVQEPLFCTLPVLPPGSDRFNLSRVYRSVPASIFRKFVYAGRGRPEKKWTFMTDIWLKGDLWLPNVFLHRSCRLSPFFDPKQISSLRDVYTAGPLPHMIKQIVKDLYRCTRISHRGDVFSILDCEADVPVVAVKYRWRAEHVMLRVAACETAAQFSGWIRILLRCLGCCPNMLTLDRDLVCGYNCTKEAEEPIKCPPISGDFPIGTESAVTTSSLGQDGRKPEKREVARVVPSSRENRVALKKRRVRPAEQQGKANCIAAGKPPTDGYPEYSDEDSNSRLSADDIPLASFLYTDTPLQRPRTKELSDLGGQMSTRRRREISAAP